jgi:hypothetical protein
VLLGDFWEGYVLIQPEPRREGEKGREKERGRREGEREFLYIYHPPSLRAPHLSHS